MKTCKVITISVYEPNNNHYLKYKLYDFKNGTIDKDFRHKNDAYHYAKSIGYNRVYGMKRHGNMY